MKILFYLPLFMVALVYLYQSLQTDSIASRYFYKFREGKTLGKEKPAEFAVKSFNETDQYKLGVLGFIMAVDIVLSLVGVFSFNGAFFVAYILFNMFLGRHMFKYKMSLFVKSLFLFFVAFNSYQLKIDLLEIILNLFK